MDEDKNGEVDFSEMECLGSIERGLSEAQAQRIWDLMVRNKEDELNQDLLEPAAAAPENKVFVHDYQRNQFSSVKDKDGCSVVDGFEHAAEATTKCMDEAEGKCEMVAMRVVVLYFMIRNHRWSSVEPLRPSGRSAYFLADW